MLNILVINGPNLNMLGLKETDKSLYGSFTLGDIERKMKEEAGKQANMFFFQSNHEGALVDKIHRAYDDKIDYIIINASSYTHTSIALRDAFLATQIPFIEVHLDNNFAREHYRGESYLADIAMGVIVGFKENSYILALAHILLLDNKTSNIAIKK